MIRFVLAALLVGCSAEEPPTLRACPPAPIGDETEERCAFAGVCRYARPNGLLVLGPDGCNDLQCSCENGVVVCDRTARGCGEPNTVPCPASLVPGAACGAGSNAECERVTDAGRFACACDQPGPIWRCAAIGP